MLVLKTISGMHNEGASYHGLRALFVLNYRLRECPLSAMVERFELRCRSKETGFKVLANSVLAKFIKKL